MPLANSTNTTEESYAATVLNINSGTVVGDGKVKSRRFKLLRSTPFRMGMAFSLVFIIVFTIAGGIFLQLMKERVKSSIDESILQNYESMYALYEELGIDAVVQLAQSKSDDPMNYSMGFHLASLDGDRIAGNVPSCTTEIGWLNIPGEDLGIESLSEYRFYTAQLGNNLLSLGRSLEPVEELGDLAFTSFGKAFFLSMLVAILASTFVAQQVQRRIGGIAGSMEKVAAGNFGTRLPISNHGDDIDEFSSQINDALAQLESNVEGVRQVSSNIAHDLKTPLNRLYIQLESASGKLEKAGVASSELELALEEAETINSTFESLLRIAQIEAGARKAKFQTLNFVDMVSSAHEVYEAVAEENSQTLLYAGDLPDRLPIFGDKGLLLQMLANLIENAIRHCPTGTAITLTAGRSDKGVWFSIGDNGSGVPAELREKIFQRLFRAESSRTSPGTGLGLSLVKAISDLHCGQLSVSDNNPGLRITIEFDDKCPCTDTE